MGALGCTPDKLYLESCAKVLFGPAIIVPLHGQKHILRALFLFSFLVHSRNSEVIKKWFYAAEALVYMKALVKKLHHLKNGNLSS